jgi:hypothetical protein
MSVISILGIVFLVALSIFARVVIWRFAKTLAPGQRIVLWIVVALAVLYVIPRMARGGLAGYRMGAQIRQQQGR